MKTFLSCFLFSLILSISVFADEADVSICHRQDFGTVSGKDTGFYFSYMSFSFQHKLIDDYANFYHGLHDAMAAAADEACKDKKENLTIINALDNACHNYCDTESKAFTKTLNLLKGHHLVKECNAICSDRTNQNKVAYAPAATPTATGENEPLTKENP